MPSVQLQQYLEMRATGASVEQACDATGIGLGEAELHEADIASGELKLADFEGDEAVDDQTTISINGGPEHSLADVSEALDTVKRGSNSVAADQLRLFIERVERLEEEKKGIADDIKDLYAEAKANGYDAKIMRLMVRLRKMEAHQRREQAALAETYADALGLQGVLPL